MSGGWRSGLPPPPAQAFVDDEKTALQDGAVVLRVRLVKWRSAEGVEAGARQRQLTVVNFYGGKSALIID
jgi:hypothetical protein